MVECREKSLCEFAQMKFDEMDRRIEERFMSLQTAIDKAESAMQIRLENMNQFRQQILDERAHFATRREAMMVTFIISLIIVIIGAVISHIVTR